MVKARDRYQRMKTNLAEADAAMEEKDDSDEDGRRKKRNFAEADAAMENNS